MVPPSRVTWALEQSGENARRHPTVAKLAVHEGESTMLGKARTQTGATASGGGITHRQRVHGESCPGKGRVVQI